VGAAVAPLLGLLGTVTGMIHTFRLISVFGTGDPRLLSAGISEALITTEAGLVVAIPLLLLHAFLSRRVQRLSEGLETSAITFLNRMRPGERAE
jgi:biopolymer transport protein ExbB